MMFLSSFGVTGEHEDFQFFLEPDQVGFRLRQFVLRQFAQIGVCEHVLGFLAQRLCVFICAIGGYDGFQVAAFAEQLAAAAGSS